MDVISTLTPEQEALITQYKAKWQAVQRSTAPIDQERTIAALRTIYAELCPQQPKEFLYYQSPVAVYQDFEQWYPRIGSVKDSMFWHPWIPICNPHSDIQWRLSKNKKQRHFAFKRQGSFLSNVINAGDSWE